MIKKNKGKLIVSSLVILLPILFGLFGGKILPEEIAVHWGIDGTADGFMNGTTVFFIFPPIFLALHWVCLILTDIFNKNAEQNKKVMGVIFWLLPVFSLVICGNIFATALGYSVKNIHATATILIAALFIIIGNYLPKTTRNISIGIKIKWTLSNDENWNATHRFAGKLYVTIGLLSLPTLFLPSKFFPYVIFTLIAVCVIPPILYSYRYYKKQLADGTSTKEDYAANNPIKNSKTAATVSIVLGVILAIVLSVILFTGDVETTLSETTFTVKASYWTDLTLAYDDVDAIEYRAESVDGEKIGGFSSARLLLGTFRNDEFDLYTRYTYTGDSPCVVLTVDNKTVVLSAKTEQEVKEIYDRIRAEISE